MGGKVGGTASKFYRETRGIKVSGGQAVPSGTVLTRRGDQWRPGLNVIGMTKLTAACTGEVYFTHKRNRYKKVVTYINIRQKKEKK
jgi:ribosomal protein L27